MQRNFFLSLIVVFLLSAGLIYFLSMQNPALDLVFLIIGDALLALISLVSFVVIKKGIDSENANAFVRAKMTGTLIKFFLCITILLIYIFVNDRQVHKPSLFLFLGLYVVYSAIEAVPLSRMAREK